MADIRFPDPKAPIHQLEIKQTFERLSERDKHYAHHLSRACWHGTRISLRQTSPEAEGIFDFILSLHATCGGRWDELASSCGIPRDQMDAFLAYAALFLCNLGNYYADGGQKFIPRVSPENLVKLARVALPQGSDFESHFGSMLRSMTDEHPSGLGYPSDSATSNYYLGERISREEIASVTKTVSLHGIEPENTRIRKIEDNGKKIYEVLQASIEMRNEHIASEIANAQIRVVSGDHSSELTKICYHLKEAQQHAANKTQAQTIAHYIDSFRTGSMNAYRASQKLWVRDNSPSVEHIIGFVESYCDPYGVRAQWEGAVCLADEDETRRMKAFVDKSAYFASMLPWATEENNGKGPFEKEILSIPNFSILHALTVCAGSVWEASNLPNYNDVRDTIGSKNMLLANRMNANRFSPGASLYLHSPDRKPYQENLHTIRFVVTVIHELLGHGTGKLLCEISKGEFNFDIKSPPISPLTSKPITSWYFPGETWTSVFEDIATSVEECRAILISAYLVDDKDLLAIFGYTEHSDLTAEQLIYLSYAHLGVEGLRSLEHYDSKEGKWTQAHSQGYFAIFKHLLEQGDGLFTIDFNPAVESLTVKVDRTKILSHGKPALGDMMCKLHVWRCTADVQACRAFYGKVTSVEGKFEEWRRFVSSVPESRWKFVQANTVGEGGRIGVRVYEESDRGIVRSWAERRV